MENQHNDDLRTNLLKRSSIEKQIQDAKDNKALPGKFNSDDYDPDADPEKTRKKTLSPEEKAEQIKQLNQLIKQLDQEVSRLSPKIIEQIESGKNPEVLRTMAENKVPGLTVPASFRSFAMENPNIGAEYISRFIHETISKYGMSEDTVELLRGAIHNPTSTPADLLNIANACTKHPWGYPLEAMVYELVESPKTPRAALQILQTIESVNKINPNLRSKIEQHPNY
ncbi:MAG: hypothetical protein AAB373_04580 [Patescibacteria group bacterium]